MNQTEKETPVRSHIDMTQSRLRRLPVTLLVLVVSCVLAGAVGAAPAMASLGIQSFTSAVTNQNGTPDVQAGSHPYQVTTAFTVSTGTGGQPTENVKDVQVDMPAGLIGDPNATPKCTVAQLDQNACPGAAQVGMMTVNAYLGAPFPIPFPEPLYNMVPPAGVAAQFGAHVLVVNSFVDVTVRTGGDYGLRTTVSNISENLPVIGTSLTLWGTPADASHDSQRTCAGTTGCSSGAPPKPFLTMPTTCAGPLTTTLAADSWQSPGAYATASYESQDSGGNPVSMTGCNRLSVSPSFTARPDTSVADSPSGLNVDVHVPQAPDDPSALATPAVKKVAVTLPSGFALNASTADGLQACSQTEFGLSTAAAPSCPDASKIGSAEIDSPLAGDPLMGSIYLAQPLANEFSSPLAVYVVAEADGVLVKLGGNVQVDPATGQTTTTFDNNPQLPFSDMKLGFFSGPRATFATPESCGTFPVSAALTPWSGGTPATMSDAFQITSGCVSGFSPTFVAGVSSPEAGGHSPFAISFSRGDTDQELSGLKVSLPPGLLAKLAGVPLCSNAQAASGTCPHATQVGTAVTGAGPGPDPLFLPGKVFLTGPYKGAPYGLVEVVPVQAGPLSFGDVIVRQSLSMDRTDSHVTVISDPLPSSLFGIIPLRLRRIDITLDRRGFMVNPTDCSAMKVLGTLTSANGIAVPVSSRFQVGGCGDLAFAPHLTVKLLGGTARMRAGAHPTFSAVLTQGGGQANLKSVQLTLPSALQLDVHNALNWCPLAAAAADACPARTAVGTATVNTPLVKGPLSGKVYLVTPHGTALPTLLILLRGAIALDLTARSAFSHNRLVTTFPAIPDAPVSRFTLTITGGPAGLLQLAHSACGSSEHAGNTDVAHNGRVLSSTVLVGTACPAPKHT